MPIVEAVAAWLRETLLPYGGIGLMLLAVCDSSFLSLPEVNDLLLMTFSIDNPGRMLEYAGLTTLGSVIGCALLYSVGRKGGEAFLKRRMASDRLLKIQNWYKRYGVLAVIIPSLLPPPTPFKIFVLSAGTFGISWPKFIGAVAVGLMWTLQSRRESSLTEREQKAVQDSTRYASVIAERTKAEAQRDSVQRQIAVISAIDGTRLIWPHVLDEVSRAMCK